MSQLAHGTQKVGGGLIILVTGGTGMLGCHLVEELVHERTRSLGVHVAKIRVLDLQPFSRLQPTADFDVMGLKNAAKVKIPKDCSPVPCPKNNSNACLIPVEWCRGDITDYKTVLSACEGCDAVMHCASIVDFGNLPHKKVFDINVVGTENILRAVCELGIQILIYTSTLDVALTCKGSKNQDETAPYAIDIPGAHVAFGNYARSKTIAEKLILEADNTILPSGKRLRTCALRPLGLFGERDTWHIGVMLRTSRNGSQFIHPGDGTAPFPHSYAGNTAHAHVCALAKLYHNLETKVIGNVGGEAFFVLDDTELCCFFEFINTYIRAKNYQTPILKLPTGLLMPMAFLAEKIRSVLSLCGIRYTLYFQREALRGCVLPQSINGTKCRQRLSFVPPYTPLQAEQRTLKYYESHPDFPPAPHWGWIASIFPACYTSGAATVWIWWVEMWLTVPFFVFTPALMNAAISVPHTESFIFFRLIGIKEVALASSFYYFALQHNNWTMMMLTGIGRHTTFWAVLFFAIFGRVPWSSVSSVIPDGLFGLYTIWSLLADRRSLSLRIKWRGEKKLSGQEQSEQPISTQYLENSDRPRTGDQGIISLMALIFLILFGFLEISMGWFMMSQPDQLDNVFVSVVVEKIFHWHAACGFGAATFWTGFYQFCVGMLTILGWPLGDMLLPASFYHLLMTILLSCLFFAQLGCEHPVKSQRILASGDIYQNICQEEYIGASGFILFHCSAAILISIPYTLAFFKMSRTSVNNKNKNQQQKKMFSLRLPISWLLVALAFAIPVLTQYRFVASVPWQPVLSIPGTNTTYVEQQHSIKHVFDVLSDYKSYKKWNSFTWHIDVINTRLGDLPGPDHRLSTGDQCILHVDLQRPLGLGHSNLTLDFQILEVKENERICWGYQLIPFAWLRSYILTTRRCMETTLNVARDKVLVRHFDNNSGILAPLVRLIFANGIQEGFYRMNKDLQTYLKDLENKDTYA